jgi:hypothetical protein
MVAAGPLVDASVSAFASRCPTCRLHANPLPPTQAPPEVAGRPNQHEESRSASARAGTPEEDPDHAIGKQSGRRVSIVLRISDDGLHPAAGPINATTAWDGRGRPERADGAGELSGGAGHGEEGDLDGLPGRGET